MAIVPVGGSIGTRTPGLMPNCSVEAAVRPNGRSVHHRTLLGADCPNAVPLDTELGDVTIHYSCSMHAGPPPVGPNQRRTLYLPFYGPDTLRLLGPHQSFEQILPGFGTGKIPSLDEVARKQGANA